MSDKGLFDKLNEYRDNGKYPLHMPGHKRESKLFERNEVIMHSVDPYDIDITEIEGFDNLHHPEGIIKRAMDNAADFFGTKKTWFLVNGSSCGLLAAINAVTDIGDSIVVGRNCHKAVYHAVELRNLKVHYMYPQTIKEYGIHGGYEPKDIENLLRQAALKGEKIKAVVVTSPTYEGVISDIKAIAEVVHKYGSILIVDEAHGAHLGINEKLPKPAYGLGGDIVIESAHKTLPAMTQTAFLHLCGERVMVEKVQECLTVYQSSSPSYVLMASLDKCVRELQRNGKEKLDKLLITLEKFHQKANKLKNIKVPGKELIGKNGVFDFDVCKLIIFSTSNMLNGKALEEMLRDKYNFEIEMTSARYVLAMTTLCDDMGQIERLAEVLEEIDNTQSGCSNMTDEIWEYTHCLEESEGLSIYEAKRKDTESVFLKNAEGRICAEYIYVYPPEIPLIVPGEIIKEKVIEQLIYFQNTGLNVKGLEGEKIKVVVS